MAYVDKEKERAMRARSYLRNAEVRRERDRIRHAEARKEKRDEINRRNRERYRANRVIEASKQRQRRIEREPWRGVEALVHKFERGDIGFDELCRQLHERNDFSNRGGRLRRQRLKHREIAKRFPRRAVVCGTIEGKDRSDEVVIGDGRIDYVENPTILKLIEERKIRNKLKEQRRKMRKAMERK